MGKTLPAGVAAPSTSGTPAPARTPPAPVNGQLSSLPLTPNRWGAFQSSDYPINFHMDGRIGTAITQMGQDAHLDIHGEPLADVLGRAATDAVVGRASSQQVLDHLKQLRDRLPAGGAARRELDEAISRLDAPETPLPPIPSVVLAPLRQLMIDLHTIPLVRRDPTRELEPLAVILDDFANGRTGGARMMMAVRALRNCRHESVEGKFEVDRAVHAASEALEEMRKTDGRNALYRPE